MKCSYISQNGLKLKTDIVVYFNPFIEVDRTYARMIALDSSQKGVYVGVPLGTGHRDFHDKY